MWAMTAALDKQQVVSGSARIITRVASTLLDEVYTSKWFTAKLIRYNYSYYNRFLFPRDAAYCGPHVSGYMQSSADGSYKMKL
jgi:hypothetical protein